MIARLGKIVDASVNYRTSVFPLDPLLESKFPAGQFAVSIRKGE